YRGTPTAGNRAPYLAYVLATPKVKTFSGVTCGVLFLGRRGETPASHSSTGPVARPPLTPGDQASYPVRRVATQPSRLGGLDRPPSRSGQRCPTSGSNSRQPPPGLRTPHGLVHKLPHCYLDDVVAAFVGDTGTLRCAYGVPFHMT